MTMHSESIVFVFAALSVLENAFMIEISCPVCLVDVMRRGDPPRRRRDGWMSESEREKSMFAKKENNITSDAFMPRTRP